MKRIAISLLLLALVLSGVLRAQDGPLPLGSDLMEIGEITARAEFEPDNSDWFPAKRKVMTEALAQLNPLIEAKTGLNPRLDGLDKYTQYVGEDGPLHERWNKLKVPLNERNWWGRCNGVAARQCQVRIQDGQWTVTINGKTFQVNPETARAWLAQAYYHSSALFRGQRSNLSETQYSEAKKLLENAAAKLEDWQRWYKGVTKRDAPKEFTQGDFKNTAQKWVGLYEDMKPAEFDRAIRTVVGKARMPIVIETYAGVEVWNYVAYEASGRRTEFTRTATDTGLRAANGNKLFDVVLTVSYKGTGAETYAYRLEGKPLDNGQYRIVGDGEWLEKTLPDGRRINSKLKHPDFIWLPTQPSYTHAGKLAEAIAGTVSMDLSIAEIDTDTLSRKAMSQIYKTLHEMAPEVAPIRAGKDPAKEAKLFESKVKGDIRKIAARWRSATWEKWRYGNSFESFLEAELKSVFESPRYKYNADVAKILLEEVLPPGARVVTDAQKRLNDAINGATAQPNKGPSVREHLAAEAKNQGRMAGVFVPAYLLKESVFGYATGDPEHVTRSVESIGTKDFWTTLGAFTGAATVTNRAMSLNRVNGVLGKAPARLQGTIRMAPGLAAGMIASQAVTGQVSVPQAAQTTAAFLAAGFIVDQTTTRAIRTASFALQRSPHPAAKIGSAAMMVGQLAATLGIADLIDHGISAGSASLTGGSEPGVSHPTNATPRIPVPQPRTNPGGVLGPWN